MGAASAVAWRRGVTRAVLARQLRAGADQVVMTALEKRPVSRYPTAGSFALAVARCAEHAPVESSRPCRLAPLRRRWGRPGVTTAFVLVLTVLGAIVAGIFVLTAS